MRGVSDVGSGVAFGALGGLVVGMQTPANEMKKCTECGQPARSRGLCVRHYTRWWRHGDPKANLNVTKRKGRICNVPGCGRKHHARGLCQMHVSAYYAHGSFAAWVSDTVDNGRR